MSAATDHVLVQLSIDSIGLKRDGFGVIGILSHTATFPERARYYGSLAAGLADWAADSPEGRALTAAFAQEPKPRRVAVLRAAGTVTQRYDISVALAQAGTTYAIEVKGKGVTNTTVSYTALADLDFVPGDVNTTTDVITETAHGMLTGAGPFRLTNSGGGLPTGTGIAADTNVWIIAPDANTYKLATTKANALAGTAIDITAAGTGTHTLRRATNDVIIAQLVQGLNAVVGLNYLATQVVGAGETDTCRVTATSSGKWFSLAVNTVAALTITQSHAAPADVTLATDLNAILQEDQGWYCLITLYNSAAYVLDVASWVEANGRIYAPDVCDSAVITTPFSGATDIGRQLFDLGYKNVAGEYHPSPAAFFADAWMARWLPTTPGKATPKFKTLAGVPPVKLTDQQKVNLRARRMNSYEQVLADRAFAWEGTVFSTVNKFLDVTRNSHWLSDEASKALLGVFVGTDIVPFTPEGIALCEGALIGVGALAVAQGVLTTAPVVTAPDVDEVQIADKEERNLRDLKLSGTFAGAIHSAVPVTVVLTF